MTEVLLRPLPFTILILLTACRSKDPACGTGTHESDGQCVVDNDTAGLDSDADTDSDSDANSDTDSDTDTDSDSDTDTGTAPACDVAADGSAALTSIQVALDDARDGDVILVCPGTYLENLDFAGTDATLVSSDGPSVTIVDGGGLGPVVLFRSSESSAAVIQGSP